MYLSSAHNEYLRVLFRLVGFVGSNIEPHSTQMSRENMVEFYLVLIRKMSRDNMVEFYLVLISNNTVKSFREYVGILSCLIISTNTVKYFHIALDFRVGFVSFDICCHNFSFPINFSELPGI